MGEDLSSTEEPRRASSRLMKYAGSIIGALGIGLGFLGVAELVSGQYLLAGTDLETGVSILAVGGFLLHESGVSLPDNLMPKFLQ